MFQIQIEATSEIKLNIDTDTTKCKIDVIYTPNGMKLVGHTPVSTSNKVILDDDNETSETEVALVPKPTKPTETISTENQEMDVDVRTICHDVFGESDAVSSASSSASSFSLSSSSSSTEDEEMESLKRSDTRRLRRVKRKPMKAKVIRPISSPVSHTFRVRDRRGMTGCAIYYGAVIELYQDRVGLQNIITRRALLMCMCGDYDESTMKFNLSQLMTQFRKNYGSTIYARYVAPLFIVERNANAKITKGDFRNLFVGKKRVVDSYQFFELSRNPIQHERDLKQLVRICEKNRCRYWLNLVYIDCPSTQQPAIANQ